MAEFDGLKAIFFNGTLKKSPETSNTQGLMDASIKLMRDNGVEVEVIRTIDHPIASGVQPDMREHGWDEDAWPDLFKKVKAADIIVVCGPIWLGDNSSQTKLLIERLYSNSADLNDKGQYVYYGKVGGCIITGNEDGVKPPMPVGSARSAPVPAIWMKAQAARRAISPTATPLS